ncbi:MAG: glycosyltransferase family 1 protein [Chloroflexi bacterium CFX4]|nr:glycosyltransferase family 1 protein [Chloroflexi bacterium CFX4]MDL1923585.1 glycosyltransferase family 4 protein [Chloroflexi bacterium CFX3]
MRIGLNALYLRSGVINGTSIYAEHLIKALVEVSSDNMHYLYLNREMVNFPLPNAPNLKRILCPVSPKNRPLRYLYEQVILPILARRHRLDVLHSLNTIAPLILPCPSVVTLHDTRFVVMSEDMSAFRRRVVIFFTASGARRARRIIADSAFAKREMIGHLALPADKIDVVPLGVQSSIEPLQGEAAAAIRAEHGITQPYIAAIGGGYPHKNIPRLVAAFGQVQAEFPHQLVLIGKLPPNVTPHMLNARIHATGYVPSAHLPTLLNGAELFVLPSLYEGFGLPALEAQAADVPLVCSTAASLPEVAGEGAHYFDPYDVQAMAAALRTCLRDPDLRAALRAKGRANLARFDWQQTARQTLAVYQRVARP